MKKTDKACLRFDAFLNVLAETKAEDLRNDIQKLRDESNAIKNHLTNDEKFMVNQIEEHIDNLNAMLKLKYNLQVKA